MASNQVNPLFWSFINPLDLAGVEPSVQLGIDERCFSKEVFKDFLKEQTPQGWVQDAFWDFKTFALQIYQHRYGNHWALASSSIQKEAIRTLLKEKSLLEKLPALYEDLQTPQHQESLERAVMHSRFCFAHDLEAQVYLERLNASSVSKIETRKMGVHKKSILAFFKAYEAFLKAHQLLDLPMLLKEVRDLFTSKGAPSWIQKDRTRYWVSLRGKEESLIQSFFEVLEKCIPIVQVRDQRNGTEKQPVLLLKGYVQEALFGPLVQELSASDQGTSDAVIFSNAFFHRRALFKMFQCSQIPVRDLRDPHWGRLDEKVKFFLLPLKMIAQNWDRETLCALLALDPEVPILIKKELSRWLWEQGPRVGLESYFGCSHSFLKNWLLKWKNLFGKPLWKGSVLKNTHLTWIEHILALETNPKEKIHEKALVRLYFQKLWDELEGLLGAFQKWEQAFPISNWWQWFEDIQKQICSVRSDWYPSLGVELYRVGQGVSAWWEQAQRKRLFLWGIQASDFECDLADALFSDREREILSAEFQVRSRWDEREDRIRSLLSWVRGADQVVAFEGEVDFQGKEQESIEVLFQTLGISDQVRLEKKNVSCWQMFWKKHRSHLNLYPVQDIKLSSCYVDGFLKKRNFSLPATFLDLYGDCPFRALVFGLWNWNEVERNEGGLPIRFRGIFYHKVAEMIWNQNRLQFLDQKEMFLKTLDQVLIQVWEKEIPPLFKITPLKKTWELKEAKRVFLNFFEEEKLFHMRAQVVPFKVEAEVEKEFSWGEKTVRVRGRVDRIDRYQDGLFLIDYKTGRKALSGQKMLERGQGLALPFYALSAWEKWGTVAVGTQWVELRRDGKRSYGVFFKNWNRTKKNALTWVQNRKGGSLFDQKPEEVWNAFGKKILETLEKIRQGRFSPEPADPSICRRCPLKIACGRSRKGT